MTYCNPLNLDYAYCPIPNFSEQGSHRATADPVIVLFQDTYYLFSTNQWGYWWSEDMSTWQFVSRRFLKPWHDVYDELCAPAAWVYKDHLYVIGSTYSDNFVIWKSSNPKIDDWEEAAISKIGGWDPAYFVDDDEKIYLYHGSSNDGPIYGVEIDPNSLQAVGNQVELIRLNDEEHGWERFGEHHDNTFLKPFIEGAWMTKHAGKYYLQYGAPGTEFSGYADGVYVADAPLGPFTYQTHNPLSLNQGGFTRGAGHGNTFQAKNGRWWHVSTVTIAVKNNFERRLGLWPTYFDDDGVMWCDTSFGDYPFELPDYGGGFTRWMLLNYQKPTKASSVFGACQPSLAFDEDMRTYWCAETASAGEWLQTDLGSASTVRSIQINYADQDAALMGKTEGICHQYRIWASDDELSWNLIVDKSQNITDVPHDYSQLETPIETRFLKLENVHIPTGKFAISGFRVFGTSSVQKPNEVKHFVVLRGDQGDRRNAWLKWQADPLASGYLVRYGIAADKLYSSVMVYGRNELYVKTLTKAQQYFFSIEAFNEGGVGPRTIPVLSE